MPTHKWRDIVRKNMNTKSDDIDSPKDPGNWYMGSGDRTMCAVLEEMRASVKTLNFAGFLGLIEECQSMGNRMEAKLEQSKNVLQNEEYRRNLKRENKELSEANKQARKELEKLERRVE